MSDPYAPPPPPPPPPLPSPPPGYTYAPAPSGKTNGLAIASLVLGIVWVYWIGSILALIFGYIAMSQIKQSGDGGKGLAIAGIVLGWVGVAVLVLVLLFFVVLGSSSEFSYS